MKPETTEDANSTNEQIQWVTFNLENEIYGINVMDIQEVLRLSEIADVPGAPDFVMGIINLRGKVVTVIDTRKCFNLDSATITDNSRIMIVESADNVLGLLVDSVAEVIYLNRSQIDRAPKVGADENTMLIEGVAKLDDNIIILCNIENLLSKDEYKELTNLE